jgi:hypothetical protein
MVFDELADTADIGAQFVDRVQEIRWELWALLGSLDNVRQPATATQWAMLAALDQLGMAARAEAAILDGTTPTPPTCSPKTACAATRAHKRPSTRRGRGESAWARFPTPTTPRVNAEP